MSVYSGLKALHLLCAVVWVGGMFFAYVVLRPSLQAIDPPQRMLVHTRVFKYFFLVIWHVMPLILLTGLGMLTYFGGMAATPIPIHAMLGIGLLMSVIFLWIYFGPYRQFRRTTDRNRMAATQNTIRKLILVNLILGLITVIIGGLFPSAYFG